MENYLLLIFGNSCLSKRFYLNFLSKKISESLYCTNWQTAFESLWPKKDKNRRKRKEKRTVETAKAINFYKLRKIFLRFASPTEWVLQTHVLWNDSENFCGVKFAVFKSTFYWLWWFFRSEALKKKELKTERNNFSASLCKNGERLVKWFRSAEKTTAKRPCSSRNYYG